MGQESPANDEAGNVEFNLFRNPFQRLALVSLPAGKSSRVDTQGFCQFLLGHARKATIVDYPFPEGFSLDFEEPGNKRANCWVTLRCIVKRYYQIEQFSGPLVVTARAPVHLLQAKVEGKIALSCPCHKRAFICLRIVAPCLHKRNPLPHLMTY